MSSRASLGAPPLPPLPVTTPAVKGQPLVSPLRDAPDTPRPAAARPEAVITGTSSEESRYRFTVLTSRLIRMEHSPTGVFTDAATQLVVNRDLGETPSFRVVHGQDRVEIITEHLHLTHVPSLGFSPAGLSVRLRSTALHAHGGTWHHGDVWDPAETFPTNLGGTTRTLDEADGAVALGPGLLSLNGITALDDSASLLLTQDEWVQPRDPGNRLADGAQDLYVFGYGQDYQEALRDFFGLTGPSPLIPRALLGNWWSRYHPYSDQEYLALMDRFAAEELPFSVAVIDMDWHVTDIDPAIGTGWTGYTWNRELFPDPAAFLAGLHERGMLTTLNVHPAQGVRRHEEAYEEVCADLGLDASTGEDVPFNIADRDFVGSYLSRLHHPLEDEGVDFWWLDWQQGGSTTVPGLDPLWMLNHVHYLDSGRERPAADGGVERRRPVTFSRFADASSHRTPVGFSGDTIISWDSLRFQPRFTATAANIGYFWWSNDIGGHMLGGSDDTMAARWFQLGCFSPINRLHSSNSGFTSKEPWRYSRDARATMEAHLRLRHRLVPYLYTWARRSAGEGIAPVRPVYHDHPRELAAYEHRGSFFFGDLLVVPFTSPLDGTTGLGRELTWLPDGVWYDLPTGLRYEATTGGRGRMLSLSRPLDRIGVLARAGSVIPLAGNLTEAAGDNPHELEIVVVPGGSGSFTLEEDDGSAQPGEDQIARTHMALTWPDAEEEDGADVVLRIRLEGAAEVVPASRLVTVRLLAGQVAGAWLGVGELARRLATEEVSGDGFTLGAGTLVHLEELSRQELIDGVQLVLRGTKHSPADWRDEVHAILDAARVEYMAKDLAWDAVQRGLSGTALLGELEALGLPETLRAAVAEVLPHS